MNRRPGYKDTSQNWDDPTGDAALGIVEEEVDKSGREFTVEDLQYLTPRMLEVLTTLSETGSATRTARAHGISRDRVYATKEAAANRIIRLKRKAAVLEG